MQVLEKILEEIDVERKKQRAFADQTWTKMWSLDFVRGADRG